MAEDESMASEEVFDEEDEPEYEDEEDDDSGELSVDALVAIARQHRARQHALRIFRQDRAVDA